MLDLPPDLPRRRVRLCFLPILSMFTVLLSTVCVSLSNCFIVHFAELYMFGPKLLIEVDVLVPSCKNLDVYASMCAPMNVAPC